MKKWALGALLLTVSISATAAERVALVIGNSAYPSNWLPNPVNDATDLSAVLKKLNFVVIPVLNGNKTVMNSKIHQFLQNINSQTKVALFFYSGHGSQYRGTNYLIPVDANLQNATTLPSSSVTAQSILSKMNTRRAGLNIMVIDACRTSPYQGVANIRGRSVSQMKGNLRGFSRVYNNTQVPTLVSYSTSPGMIAKDGTGRNSPYTIELLKFIKQPKVPIVQVFNNISVAVSQKTNKKQIPWNNISAVPNIFLGNIAVNYNNDPDAKRHVFDIFTKAEIEKHDKARKAAKYKARKEEREKKLARDKAIKEEKKRKKSEMNSFVDTGVRNYTGMMDKSWPINES